MLINSVLVLLRSCSPARVGRLVGVSVTESVSRVFVLEGHIVDLSVLAPRRRPIIRYCSY